MTDTPAKDSAASENSGAATQDAESAQDQDAQASADPAEAESKRKFREALERKAKKNSFQESHQEGRQKLTGSNGPQGRNRQFRRKSG